jgi:hypothetical protein
MSTPVGDLPQDLTDLRLVDTSGKILTVMHVTADGTWICEYEDDRYQCVHTDSALRNKFRLVEGDNHLPVDLTGLRLRCEEDSLIVRQKLGGLPVRVVGRAPAEFDVWICEFDDGVRTMITGTKLRTNYRLGDPS